MDKLSKREQEVLDIIDIAIPIIIEEDLELLKRLAKK